MVTKTELGNRIKEAMDRRKMTQKELAAALQITPSKVSNYVTGKNFPPADVLADMATALEVTADWLLGIEKPKSTEQGQLQLNTLGDVLRVLYAIDQKTGLKIERHIEHRTGDPYTDDPDRDVTHYSFSIRSPAFYWTQALSEWAQIQDCHLDGDLMTSVVMPAWAEQTAQKLDQYDETGKPFLMVDDDGELPF